MFNLIPNNILTLNGLDYHLRGEPIKGGSSLVYKARLQNSIHNDIFMIKELHPSKMAITRSKDGTICFSGANSTEVAELKQRAIREAEIVKKLRHDSINDNNNPWFKSYSYPIEANNT